MGSHLVLMGQQHLFVLSRFAPCLVSGLAYYIAMKRPEVANRVAPLKQEYEFQFELAAGEKIKIVRLLDLFLIIHSMEVNYV